MVITRFQGDKKGSAPGLRARVPQCQDLRVGFTRTHVPAFADDAAFFHDNRAYHRIGMGKTLPLPCQFQGPDHKPAVIPARH